MTLEQLINGHDLTEKRIESLKIAIEAGVSEETLIKMRDVWGCFRRNTASIPQHRFARLSRGKGWCRKGKGDKAVWGEQEDDGDYRVGPGK